MDSKSNLLDLNILSMVFLSRVWALFSGAIPGVYCYYHGVILVWILIMCGGEKIHQSFEGYLQTFFA